MSRRFWLVALASLVALRVAIPLVVLAASGHDLPGVPPYDYTPLNGDATGFYAEARELISVFFGPAGAVAALLLVAGAVAVWRLRRSWMSIAAGCLAISLAASALVLGSQQTTGSAVVGWPLLWSIPLFPFRVVGLLDDDVAFAVGLLLSLAANAVTVVATAYIGLRSTGSRAVGVAAAALYAIWPLLTRPLAGTSAWENGQWNVDVGLHLYTEPISTALVATAIALLLAPVARSAPAGDGRRAARLRHRRAALERALRGRGRGRCWRCGWARGGRCRLQRPESRGRRSSRSTGRRGIRRSRTCPASRSRRPIAAGSTR